MAADRAGALDRLLRWREFQEGTAQADHQRRASARVRAEREAADARGTALTRQAQRRDLLQRHSLDPQVLGEAAAIESRAWHASDAAEDGVADARRHENAARTRHLHAREASRVVASRARRIETEAMERMEKAMFDEVAGLLAARRGRR